MSPVFFLMQFAVLAYALVGGVFLAFSDFIMRSLSLKGGVSGAETMQVINREVFRWVFMALFLGMAAASLGIAVYGLRVVGGGPGTFMMIAGLVYFIGGFCVTVCFNVPMNETLAGMDPSSQTTRAYWTDTYLPRWTFWNTVRTLACCVSSSLLLFGLLWAAQMQAQTG